VFQVIFSAAFIVVSAVQPARIPAGVSPQQCPNYPYCAIGQPAVQVFGNTAGIGGSGLGLGTGALYGNYYGGQGLGGSFTPSVGSPARLPAGVSPQQCPNYPYCGIAQPAVQAFGNTASIGGFGSGYGGH